MIEEPCHLSSKFHCSIPGCSKSFTTYLAQRVHKSRDHTEEEKVVLKKEGQFKCICGKAFTAKSNLSRHRKKQSCQEPLKLVGKKRTWNEIVKDHNFTTRIMTQEQEINVNMEKHNSNILMKTGTPTQDQSSSFFINASTTADSVKYDGPHVQSASIEVSTQISHESSSEQQLKAEIRNLEQIAKVPYSQFKFNYLQQVINNTVINGDLVAAATPRIFQGFEVSDKLCSLFQLHSINQLKKYRSIALRQVFGKDTHAQLANVLGISTKVRVTPLFLTLQVTSKPTCQMPKFYANENEEAFYQWKVKNIDEFKWVGVEDDDAVNKACSESFTKSLMDRLWTLEDEYQLLCGSYKLKSAPTRRESVLAQCSFDEARVIKDLIVQHKTIRNRLTFLKKQFSVGLLSGSLSLLAPLAQLISSICLLIDNNSVNVKKRVLEAIFADMASPDEDIIVDLRPCLQECRVPLTSKDTKFRVSAYKYKDWKPKVCSIKSKTTGIHKKKRICNGKRRPDYTKIWSRGKDTQQYCYSLLDILSQLHWLLIVDKQLFSQTKQCLFSQVALIHAHSLKTAIASARPYQHLSAALSVLKDLQASLRMLVADDATYGECTYRELLGKVPASSIPDMLVDDIVSLIKIRDYCAKWPVLVKNIYGSASETPYIKLQKKVFYIYRKEAPVLYFLLD